mgnify:CR=1 FL=1
MNYRQNLSQQILFPNWKRKGPYLGKIKDAVDEILIEFSNGIREIVSPRYCLEVKQ